MTGPDIKDKEFNPSPIHQYYFIRKGLYQGIKKHSSRLKGKLIDLGCGSKPYRELFSCDEYIGVDFENPGHPHQNEQIDVFYDGKTIPFPENTFDSALCTEVFEHIFNLPQIIAELNRVLKKDGILLATCPFVWKEHEVPHDYARYTLFALDDLLVKNGFKKIEADKSGNFIEVIVQLQVLFLFDKFYGKVRKFAPLRMIFKLLFILIPNSVGTLLSRLFHNDKQMYLNNIVIYQKC